MTGGFGRFLRHNTIALIALFFALAGTTFAASTALPRNSVGTKQIKKNAVTSVKIKNNQVTGADVKESSLAKVPSAANADHATAADSATNATNATNAANAAVAANATGLAGPLAPGQTLTGEWATAGHKAAAADFIDEGAITFAIPLSATPTRNFINVGDPATAQCPGTAVAPAAAPGQLCFYASLAGAGGLNGDTTRFGASYFVTGLPAAPVNFEVRGTWAVQAAASSAPDAKPAARQTTQGR